VYGIRTIAAIAGKQDDETNYRICQPALQAIAQTEANRIVDDLLLFGVSAAVDPFRSRKMAPSSGPILRSCSHARRSASLHSGRPRAGSLHRIGFDNGFEFPINTSSPAKRLKPSSLIAGGNMRFKLSKVATSFQNCSDGIRRSPNSLLGLFALRSPKALDEDWSSAMSFGRVFPGARGICRQSRRG